METENETAEDGITKGNAKAIDDSQARNGRSCGSCAYYVKFMPVSRTPDHGECLTIGLRGDAEPASAFLQVSVLTVELGRIEDGDHVDVRVRLVTHPTFVCPLWEARQ